MKGEGNEGGEKKKGKEVQDQERKTLSFTVLENGGGGYEMKDSFYSREVIPFMLIALVIYIELRLCYD